MGAYNSKVDYKYEDSQGWGDLLTKYGTATFQYDEIGNLTSDGTWNYSWRHGRELASMSNGSTTWTYTYNTDGLRIGRTDGINTYTYVYNGSQLRQMKKGNDVLFFTYDADGRPMSVTHQYITNGYVQTVDTYYYVTNLQGDVIAILDSIGQKAVEYVYDAWGRICSPVDYSQLAGIAWLNPLRYRGYVYDRETGLYYLQSRYYNPTWGRFINADDTAYLGADGTPLSYNLFAYCGNNPVMGYDPTGHWDWGTFWSGFGMVATAIGAIALSVTTFGAGIPLAMSLIAGVTLGAGVLTGINGVATIVEAGSDGYNFMRDGLFNEVLGLSDSAYNVYSGITEGVAIAGSMILGFYHTTGQYKAAKASQEYLGKGYSTAGKNRWLSKDGLRQVRWDTTHHPYKGKTSPLHFNWYEYASPIGPGIHGKPIKDIHIWLKLFSYYS